MYWRDRVSIDPSICHGKACISGTRVLVAVVLANLAAGVREGEILCSYPTLSADDIQATLAYAAELVRLPN